MTHLRGKHVVVTGGSQGIGAAVAREAFASGARVSLIARREDALRATAQNIGNEVNWRAADVTDSASVSEAIEALEALSGSCDVLVCCAGIALPGRFLEVPADEFDNQWQANVRGSITAIRSVLPGMVKRGAGHLALVSSTAGVLGVPGYTAYAATKFAIRGLADSLRYEVEPHGVRVSVLYPPDTDTPGFAAESLRKLQRPPQSQERSRRFLRPRSQRRSFEESNTTLAM